MIAAVAGPFTWSDNRKSWLARAARRAGISYRQTRGLWYGETTDPHCRSARLMRDAAETAARLQSAATAMHVTDADFFHNDIAALTDMSRRYRARSDAGERGEDDSHPPRHRRRIRPA
jgi:hypothetical protein